ncbi:hypothetical protein [Paenibacillus lignilyticus]|uniref:Uncharacterized protein n=1 Tax=Paenibacillus lignilyticus TaxID=1172615 RepID=A0ABS5CGX1_9BACL|nr:hypothetical protein [Paenibacillus lignilyticus]MBP3965134.1 hypothetical protein [Paenibacillus lignilyticus]
MILTIRKLIVLVAVVVLLIVCWNSYASSTYELATVKQVGEDEITVVNLGNRERTIAVPVDISKLIEIDKDYIISYEKRLWDKYRLKSIHSAFK